MSGEGSGMTAPTLFDALMEIALMPACWVLWVVGDGR